MNYNITLFVSKFGLYVGAGFIALSTIAGFIGGGFLTGLGSCLISATLMVPFLMFCEGMHALVSIANNTKRTNADNHLNKAA